MQKAFSIFVVVILFSVFFNSAFGALYGYTTSDLGLSWSVVTNPVAIDRDNDGFIDTVYSASTRSIAGGVSVTFTKVFGTGQSSIVQTLGGLCKNNFGTGTESATYGVYDEDYMIITTYCDPVDGGTSWTCTAFVYLINVSTGQKTTVFSRSGSESGDCEITGGWINFINNQIGFAFHSYEPNSATHTYTLYRNSTIITSGGTTNAFTPFGVKYGSTLYKPNLSSTTNVDASFDSHYGMVYNNTADNKYYQVYQPSPSAWLDRNATMVLEGMKIIPQTSVPFLTTPKWSDLLENYIDIDASDNNEKALFLDIKVIDNTLSSQSLAHFIIKDGSNYYLAVDNGADSLRYATMPDLTNYAFQNYLLDSYTPVLKTTAATGTMPAQSITINTPLASTATTRKGTVGLLSGDTLTVTGVDRSFTPAYSDLTKSMPVVVPPTTGLTAVSVNVKNAPSNSIIKVTFPSYSLLGQDYNWSTKLLTADNLFSIDLPTSTCFDTYIADGSQKTKVWESLGNLCASGTMPKSVTYSSNLSFTFWSLTWGTAHKYDSTSDTVQTMVRHSTAPFDYYVTITDRNGTEVISNLYTGNSTDVDLQDLNITSVQKPAVVKIKDDTNKTLYSATLGYPNYGSSLAAWFNQNLSYKGFSLLAMLPLIFGAMYTRNTVGIGTCVTVAFIATMVWAGFITIPDVAIWLMAFVAAIGLIAYKSLSAD